MTMAQAIVTVAALISGAMLGLGGMAVHVASMFREPRCKLSWNGIEVNADSAADVSYLYETAITEKNNEAPAGGAEPSE
jgi:hypothetical protein